MSSLQPASRHDASHQGHSATLSRSATSAESSDVGSPASASGSATSAAVNHLVDRSDSSFRGPSKGFALSRRGLFTATAATLAAAVAADAGLTSAKAAEGAAVSGARSPLWFLGEAGEGAPLDAAKAMAGKLKEKEVSRIYDATALGEPVLLTEKATRKAWDRLLAARVVYLGEAERVEDPTDKVG